MRGTIIIFAVAASIAFGQATPVLRKDVAQAGGVTYCRSTTGNDTYTCGLTPALTAYTRGGCLVLDADTANTGAATVNVDAVGAKSILTRSGSALSDGDITADKPKTICYDGTQYIIQGDGTTAGSADVSGGSSLTTVGAVPFVVSSGTLTQDQYFKYVAVPGSPVAGDTYTRAFLGDATAALSANSQAEISIDRVFTALNYTSTSNFDNIVGFNSLLRPQNTADWNTNPTRVSLYGIFSGIDSTSSTNAIGAMTGQYGYAKHAGSGTLQSAYGLNGDAFVSGGGVITTAYGVRGSATNFGTGGLVTGYGGLFYAGNDGTTGGGYVTTIVGVGIEHARNGAVTTSYSLRTTTSGATTPTTGWDISAETGYASRFLGTVGIGASNTTAAAVELVVYDAAAGGSTRVDVRAGDTQSGNLQEWQNNAGTALSAITSAGAFTGYVAAQNVSNVTAQSTSQSTVTVATSPTAGNYRLNLIANQNALCTTGNGTVSFTFNWTDAGNARSLSTGTLTLSTAQQTSGYLSGLFPIYVNSGNVTYTSTVTACATGTASYDVHVALERLQ